MHSFVDELNLTLSSGHGGAGCVSFRREKYVPKGGPDGGDGGDGGDVVFTVKDNLKTLSHLRNNSTMVARNGESGMGARLHGKKGNDLLIDVPLGTNLIDAKTGELLHSFDKLGENWLFLKGGSGGKGNWHFRSSRNQAPRYAQKGKEGLSRWVRLELSLIADVGLVGLPNAGKSSLIRSLTNSTSKVGSYPFTTTVPHLGVLRLAWTDIILADIPGIIKGASSGSGLGLRFLKHISRTKGLAFLIDASQSDWLNTFDLLQQELKLFDKSLLSKRRVLVLTKCDLWQEDAVTAMKRRYPQEVVIAISCFTGEGLQDIKESFTEMCAIQKDK